MMFRINYKFCISRAVDLIIDGCYDEAVCWLENILYDLEENNDKENL